MTGLVAHVRWVRLVAAQTPVVATVVLPTVTRLGFAGGALAFLGCLGQLRAVPGLRFWRAARTPPEAPGDPTGPR